MAAPSPPAVYPWYDSVWLSQFVEAQAIIQAVKPGVLPDFVEAFRVLRTRSDFETRLIGDLFDRETLDDIRQVVHGLRPTDLELHEVQDFGRFVVHDHPFFTALQQRTLPRVAEVVGEEVEASYNFLSMYGPRGVCAPHLDAPKAKWTLDLCVNQHAPWPIYFSQVCDWPDPDHDQWTGPDWQRGIKDAASLRFTPCSLEPGQAVVFSGSSQFHYRDPIPPDGGREFCDLLFFHFIPKGAAELVRPRTWARVFGIPELGALSG